MRAVALGDGDMPAGATLTLLPEGDQVAGQVSLDVCHQRFDSEALRTTRYQQLARAGDGTFIVSNENILYRSADDAAEAMREIRTAVVNCPAAFVPPVVRGQPSLKFVYTDLTETEAGTMVNDHVALAVHSEDRTGRAYDIVTVYQWRGRVLVTIYGLDATTVKPYVSIAARHLDNLPSVDTASPA